MITIPAGVQHTFWNANFHKDMHAHMLLEITLTPALHAEEVFRTIWGLAVDYGGTLKDVNPLQLMLTVEEGGVQLASMPAVAIFVSRHLVSPLARFTKNTVGSLTNSSSHTHSLHALNLL